MLANVIRVHTHNILQQTIGKVVPDDRGHFERELLLLREPVPTPSTQAWLAWGYLVIFGSLIAFTSYVASLRLLPIDVVMTHAYVNPVVAVLLGWFVLHEPVTPSMLSGGAMVLVGVAGVFRDSHLRTQR